MEMDNNNSIALNYSDSDSELISPSTLGILDLTSTFNPNPFEMSSSSTENYHDDTTLFSSTSADELTSSTSIYPGMNNSFDFSQSPGAALNCSNLLNITNLNLTSTNFNSSILATPFGAGMATWKIVLILIPLLIISLTIILGNLLVIVSVFTQKSLRAPQNIYIVSLSIADLAVALLVLPLNITTTLSNDEWKFGAKLCKLYLITDVSLCTSSILHLCAIAIDRYRAITDGLNYIQHRNIKSVSAIIMCIWIISFWIGTEPVLDLKPDLTEPYSCVIPNDFGHSIHLAIGALFFPLCVMTFLYIKIYEAIKERLQERAKVNCIELTSDYDTTENRIENASSTTDNNGGVVANGSTKNRSSKRKMSKQLSTFLTNKKKFSLSRERKAARTLGLIMGAFIICWLPLGFLNVISSMCPNEYQPPMEIFHTLTWLGYINSGLNPIIYAASNQEFQKGFKKVLKLH